MLVDFVIELSSAVWIYLCAAIKLRKDVVETDLKRQKRNHLWSGRLDGQRVSEGICRGRCFIIFNRKESSNPEIFG